MLTNHLLEEALALIKIDTNFYRGTKPLWQPLGNPGIFGGALIAQALNAAMKTVNTNLDVHSLHAYFISP
jgi:acyl-CoA thioesterase 8